MRIFFTSHVFMPRWTFGTEVYTHALATAFQEKGHEVRVITCESNMTGGAPDVDSVDDEWAGVAVHRLSFNVMATSNPVRSDYFNPHVEQYLIEYFRREEPDLVHVCHAGHLSTAVITAAKHHGLPVVATATDFWLICPTSQLLRHDRRNCQGPVSMSHCVRCYAYQRDLGLGARPLVDRLPARLLDLLIEVFRHPWADRHGWKSRFVRDLLTRPSWMAGIMDDVDLFFSPSRFLRRLFVENGMAPDRMRVSAHGIDGAWADTQPPSTSSDHVRLAFIGMLGWHKGVHVAVEAFDRLRTPRGATLDLYGDNQHFPDYYERLAPVIERNPGIAYRGRFPHDEISRVLADVDVLVMPSVWYENTPIIMYEAFATKTPVVASNIGGMAELIEDFEGGWTFEVGDARDLARVLQDLIDEPERIAAASAGIRPVRRIEEHVADLEAAYAEIMARYRGAAPTV